jgi:predicted secreted protein
VLACAGVVLGVAQAVAGDAASPMNRVSFQVERSRDVANDWIHAVVGITAEDTDSTRLADHVNQTMARALSLAKAATNVRVKSGGYSTHPVHEGGKLRRWRASQDLILESADVDRVTNLVGALQNELQLRSIRFEVSPQKRRAAEDELLVEALAAFRARGDIIRESLGARGYEIVQISVDTGGPPVRPMMMETRAMSAVAPPALEGGSSRLVVHVRGSIELE